MLKVRLEPHEALLACVSISQGIAPNPVGSVDFLIASAREGAVSVACINQQEVTCDNATVGADEDLHDAAELVHELKRSVTNRRRVGARRDTVSARHNDAVRRGLR